MQRIRVKIEGLRDPRTALRIAQMGADAIGLVFAQSPRWVSPEQARAVVDALPPWVATVGVFVNADADTINRVIDRTRIGFVQLHGDEGPELVGKIERPCIKAFRVRDEGWLTQVRTWIAGLADRSRLAAVLLDAYADDARGGTGRRFNWDMVADARTSGAMAGLDPIILAGGLDSTCVGDAIELVAPWAVDVASGVESSPGVKDLAKVESFIRATREGDELRSEFWQ
ncbi:MAG: phosphoribosylanthranilate isomerase [Planctomycetaceae bacterium]|nr:phosphoribosylanthranilate isomerase [Planctomycetaceae bacterium]